MYSRLIIDGNAVYEIDEECLKRREYRNGRKNLIINGPVWRQEQGKNGEDNRR